MRDRLRGETRDIMIAGHYPHLPGLLALLVRRPPDLPTARRRGARQRGRGRDVDGGVAARGSQRAKRKGQRAKGKGLFARVLFLSSDFLGCNSDFFDVFPTGRVVKLIFIDNFGFFVPTRRRSAAFCDSSSFKNTVGSLFPIFLNPTTLLFVILDF